MSAFVKCIKDSITWLPEKASNQTGVRGRNVKTKTDSSKKYLCYMQPFVPAHSYSDKMIFYDLRSISVWWGLTFPFQYAWIHAKGSSGMSEVSTARFVWRCSVYSAQCQIWQLSSAQQYGNAGVKTKIYIDSIMPKVWGFRDWLKGYLSSEKGGNYAVVYPYPEAYGVQHMSLQEWGEFHERYESVCQSIFNSREEVVQYCQNNVRILSTACTSFKDLVHRPDGSRSFQPCLRLFGLYQSVC